jgi:hypothetical protein
MKFGLMYNTGYCGTDPDQLVVGPFSTDEAGQREEISAFADRLRLR